MSHESLQQPFILFSLVFVILAVAVQAVLQLEHLAAWDILNGATEHLELLLKSG